MNSYEYEVMILEHHLDTFGHVNNATYLQLYEEARWDLITKNGYGLKEVFERQIGPTILEINIRFMREIKNRQKIKIVTKLLEYPGKVATLEQKMINEKGEECNLMTMKIALFDLKQRKLIAPTSEWKRAIGYKE